MFLEVVTMTQLLAISDEAAIGIVSIAALVLIIWLLLHYGVGRKDTDPHDGVQPVWTQTTTYKYALPKKGKDGSPQEEEDQEEGEVHPLHASSLEGELEGSPSAPVPGTEHNS